MARISKATRRRRTIRVVLILIIILALLAFGVRMLRRRVTTEYGNAGDQEVQTATVSRGSISTTVSGSGNLADEDVEEIQLYSSVEIDEILVEAGDTVQQGDTLATVNMSTVLSAMAAIQTQINELDEEISEDSGDELDDEVTSALAGRVMKIFAADDDDVSTVMYENGALALISLDGYLAVQIATEDMTVELTAGDEVIVTDSEGEEYEGEVDKIEAGVVTILISDEDAIYGDAVTVTIDQKDKDEEDGDDGEETEEITLGTGTLYIHEMLKITGIAGTIKDVKVSENQKISAGKTLFTLTDTSFSANYTSLLAKRQQYEEQLQQLIQVYQDGALLSPISGSISSVGDDSSSSASTYSTGSSMGQMSFGNSQSGSASTAVGAMETVLSICPGTAMTVSISVDETDILSLAVGQTASVSVDALGDEIIQGTVTEIDTTATSSGGVTVYTVTTSFAKTEQMLSGMSASISIQIDGVEDALLIPSDALSQTSATSYVYTSYDAEIGSLGGLTEVTTGLDNGSYVEITGGLEEGATVYYFEEEEQGFGFGGMNFGNMGGMPNMGGSGGVMPNMGGNSGMPNFGGSGSGMPNMGGGGGGRGDFGGGMPGGFGG